MRLPVPDDSASCFGRRGVMGVALNNSPTHKSKSLYTETLRCRRHKGVRPAHGQTTPRRVDWCSTCQIRVLP